MLHTKMVLKNEEFVIGENDFFSLEIRPSSIDKFYFFFDKKNNRLIKQFILLEKERVDYICDVTLIKKNDKFTPRLSFSTRDKSYKKILKVESTTEEKDSFVKARVSLDECYENFWKLIGFLQSLKEIEVPKEKFSLISLGEEEIVSALHNRDTKSIVNIIKGLSLLPEINISQEDLHVIIKRKEKLEEFKRALTTQSSDEGWWQIFFEQNKWIFGYGLDYHILRQEQTQPLYGGSRVDGGGGHKGDYLASTVGDLNFTVLVEIKTPATKLLQGSNEIRSGAWSLSKDLTDAVSQIEANIETWEKDGCSQDDNKDRLESAKIFTVKPKGIIVIGNLSQFENIRSKRSTFQRFRKSIHGIDIITFDELYNRASFIVESKD